MKKTNSNAWARAGQSGGVERKTAAGVRYVNLEEVEELPTAVKHFFHLVLKEGAPIINRAVISQTGGFRARPEMKKWSNMKAKQYLSSNPRSFAWHATITLPLGLSIKVCDSYRGGKGKIRGKVLSLFTLIDSHNRSELNEGALQRYLAEAVWHPTSLLPSQGVTWQPLDDHRAQATLRDCDLTVSLEFEFNEQGEVVSVYSPARYREVSGQYEATPWKGRFSRYVKIQDYRIPLEGEVAWQLPDQLYSYWKARIHGIRYE